MAGPASAFLEPIGFPEAWSTLGFHFGRFGIAFCMIFNGFSVNVASGFADCRNALPQHAAPRTSQEPAKNLPSSRREPVRSCREPDGQTQTDKFRTNFAFPRTKSHTTNPNCKIWGQRCRAAWRIRIGLNGIHVVALHSKHISKSIKK